MNHYKKGRDTFIWRYQIVPRTYDIADYKSAIDEIKRSAIAETPEAGMVPMKVAFYEQDADNFIMDKITVEVVFAFSRCPALN